MAHEFFHSWNVRRIRPRSLEPFNFEQANMSGELWFAEGFTNYYGVLALQRVGLSSLDRFTKSMGSAVNAVLTAPGRKELNAVEMSEQAPFVDAATANDPVNTANNFISYYTYGQALALAIDLSIRTEFPGKSLDDWMRAMWQEHPDVDKPYTLSDLERTLAQTTGSARFAHDVFEKHIYGREPFDYAALLARAGFSLEKQHPNTVWLGTRKFSFSEQGGAEIASPTLRDSPLYQAGLDVNDSILKWNGTAIGSDDALKDWLAARKPGETVQLDVQSRAGKKQVTLVLTEDPSLIIVPVERLGHPLDSAAERLRSQWLSSKAIQPLPKIEKYCHQCKRALPAEFDHCPYDGALLFIVR